MALPATDTFTGTDSTDLSVYSASWTANQGVIQIESNGAHPFTGGGDSLYSWNADTFPNDQYAQAVQTVITATGVYLGPAVRAAASGFTCYRCMFDNIQIYLQKVVAGTQTTLTSVFTGVTTGQTVKISAQGTTVAAYIDGSLISGFSVTDSALTAGRGGLSGFGAGDQVLDNWESGSLANSALADPSFIAAGALVATNTAAATLTPALPAGWAADDFLLLVIAGRPNGSTITNGLSAGWTQYGSGQFFEVSTGANDLHVDIWWRIAQSGDTAPTVTPDSDFLPGSTTGGASAHILAYRGISKSRTFDLATPATGSNAAATTWTPPSVTTVTPRAFVISVVATADDNTLTLSTANSFAISSAGASYQTTTGSDHSAGTAYLVNTTPGAATMPVWNQSANGSDAWVGLTLALRPANADLSPLRVLWPAFIGPLLVQ